MVSDDNEDSESPLATSKARRSNKRRVKDLSVCDAFCLFILEMFCAFLSIAVASR